MKREVDIRTARTLAAKAIDHGDIISPHKFVLNYAADCLDPIYVEVTGRNEWTPTGYLSDTFAEQKPTRRQYDLFIDMHLRCRKCRNCLRAKRMMWAHRAIAEWQHAPRTWFVTLTFPYAEQYKNLCKVEAAAGKSSWIGWSPEFRFKRLANEMCKYVTKYLKRVRAPLASRQWQQVSFRYLLVAEAHKTRGYDGTEYSFERPHFHLLIHESPLQPIVHARLKHHWPYIMDARLVNEERDCWYTTKYVAKEDRLARVRASRTYGTPPSPSVCRVECLETQERTDPHHPPNPVCGSAAPAGEVQEDGSEQWVMEPWRFNRVQDPDTHQQAIPWDESLLLEKLVHLREEK